MRPQETKAAETDICARCGQLVAPKNNRCPRCGSPMTLRTNRLPWVLGVITLLAVVFVLFLAWKGLQNSDDEDAPQTSTEQVAH